MPVCRSCGKSSALVRAHVIPEAFFRQIRQDNEAPLLVTSVKGHFPRRAPIGVYDSNILCSDCEERLGAADSYGAMVLLNQFDLHFKPLVKDNNVVAFESRFIKSELLLKFFVSVIWRASLSNKPFYQHVSLGAHEAVARDIALSVEPLEFGGFDVVMSKWRLDSSKTAFIPTLLDPRRERWSGVNAYRLYLGNLIAYVKVDSRPFSPAFRGLSLRSGSVVRVITRAFESSSDLAALIHTARQSHRNSENFMAARVGHRR